MTNNSLLQIIFFLAMVVILAQPLGAYISRVYNGESVKLNRVFGRLERFIYRFCGIDPTREMSWQGYAVALLLVNLFGLLAVHFIQVWQQHLPWNPQALGTVKPDLAFNTAVSYVTNTNWQAYAGETTLSYCSQMLALTVQNFLSAATGMAVLVALVRGLIRSETTKLGNFWADFVRGTLYILLPLATILAILLVSQGVIQNFKPYIKTNTLQTTAYMNKEITSQTIPGGPAASQVAIKQLGTNGGGFFGANSAHPLENPTPFSNFLEMLAIILIPASLCFAFGSMVKDKRQGFAVFIAMTIIFVPLLLYELSLEQKPNPTIATYQVNQRPSADEVLLHATAGGNMEGKETRFGITNSALWSVTTTAIANGSVNSMLDSYTPLGGMIPLWLMQLGEIIYGGAGSGLYTMLLFVILTVFIAGLMVGRTPEYLGKKIEVFEMKMACVAILVPHMIVLLFVAIAVSTNIGITSILNKGMHGFSEILYAFSSTANNNGSAFAGLASNNVFYNVLTAIAMIAGRFFILFPVLAIAGSFAKKKLVPVTQGTLPTHTMLFIGLLVAVILIIGALAFFPALALGPIAENLAVH